MFENSHIRIRTLIFRPGRVRTNAFPIKLYGFQLHCSKESKLWKSFFSEIRRELPFGFEPKTCWFVINCSIHLSYDSISRFLNYFNHFKLMGIKTNLKENGIFTAHRARTWGVFLRTVKLRTPQGGFEPPIPLWYCGLRLGESSFNYLPIISKTSLNYVRLQSTTIFWRNRFQNRLNLPRLVTSLFSALR